MTGIVVLAIVAEWVVLALVGKKLAKAIHNPDTWPLPLLMGGVFGLIVMAAASYPWRLRGQARSARARNAAGNS